MYVRTPYFLFFFVQFRPPSELFSPNRISHFFFLSRSQNEAPDEDDDDDGGGDDDGHEGAAAAKRWPRGKKGIIIGRFNAPLK